jgi:hypothetical protein
MYPLLLEISNIEQLIDDGECFDLRPDSPTLRGYGVLQKIPSVMAESRHSQRKSRADLEVLLVIISINQALESIHPVDKDRVDDFD